MKFDLGRKVGRRRVEAGVALGQREGPVPGQRAARLDMGVLQRLGGQPLHRIAIKSFDPHGGTSLSWSLGITIFCRNGLGRVAS